MDYAVSNLIHTPHPDGFRAEWPGFSRAFALFSIEGSKVFVSDIFRDNAQAKGSAGAMLAAAVVKAGLARPSNVRLTNILDTQPTQNQLQRGVSISETVLGRTLEGMATSLGSRITGFCSGHYREKLWIEAAFL